MKTTNEAAAIAQLTVAVFKSRAEQLGIQPTKIPTGKRGRQPFGWTDDQIAAITSPTKPPSGPEVIPPQEPPARSGPDPRSRGICCPQENSKKDCMHLIVDCVSCGKRIKRVVA